LKDDVNDEERIHKAKQQLRKVGYTLLSTPDKSRFVVAHLGSETVVNVATTLDELEKMVLAIEGEAWRRA
jgi:hypothetical protein